MTVTFENVFISVSILKDKRLNLAPTQRLYNVQNVEKNGVLRTLNEIVRVQGAL